MKHSLKTRFWFWVYRLSSKLMFYSDRKGGEQLVRDNPQCSIGTISNNYPWDKIWEDDDSTLYSMSDGEPIE